MPVILVPGRLRQDTQEFKNSLSYVVSLRPPWAVQDPVFKTNNSSNKKN